MAVGQDHGSRPAGKESPAAAAREDGQPGVAAIDGLLIRVARGDEEAFAAVCDHVVGAVYGLARRIIRDEARSDQVARDVLVEVWRTASRFSPATGSGLSWIMTIARRRAVSFAEAAAGNDRAARLRPSGASGEVAERGGASLLAHRGLAALPGPQREAVLLASCGYTPRQIADLLGLPAGTVAERLRDGLVRLGSCPE